MKIAVVQPSLAWEDKKSNFSRLEKMLVPLSGSADIVVLPEMFSTGFTMSVGTMAESGEGETLRWMRKVSENGNFAVCGSFIAEEAGRYFNRLAFVTPQSVTYFYDKRHLFSMGDEDRHFSRGNERVIFSYKGFRIVALICYDLRFPVWSRNRNEYDLALYVSNWPAPRIHAWDTLLKARAIENQCFVAASNICGTDGNGIVYNGHSQVISPRGEVISHAGEEEVTITVNISKDDLLQFRQKFNVLGDADDFMLRL